MTLCRDITCFAATEKTESRYEIWGWKTSQMGCVQDWDHYMWSLKNLEFSMTISCLKPKLCGNCYQLILTPHWTLVYLAIPISSLIRISDPWKVLSSMPRFFDLSFSVSLGSYLWDISRHISDPPSFVISCQMSGGSAVCCSGLPHIWSFWKKEWPWMRSLVITRGRVMPKEWGIPAINTTLRK
jgi:hypothetical protein